MRKVSQFVALGGFVLLALSASAQKVQKGKGGGGGGGGPTSSTETITAFLQAAPRGSSTGVAVTDPAALLLDVTDAALSGQRGVIATVSLPVQTLELRHLSLAPTFEGQAVAVPNVKYTNLTVSFANPRLVIFDAQGNPMSLDSTTTPSVTLGQTQVSATVSLPASTTGYAGLVLGIDLTQSISVNSSGNYVVTPVLSVSPTSASSGNQLVDAEGTIASIDYAAQTMTIELRNSNLPIQAVVSSSTLLSPTVGTFSNLSVNEDVLFAAQMQANGTYAVKFLSLTAPDFTTDPLGPMVSSPAGTVQIVGQE
jgi:hypothetical protein